MSKYLIYGLFDPRNGQLRYVGKSSCGMKRPNFHTMPSGRKGNTWNARWLSSLFSDGFKPEIEIIESFENDTDLEEAERFWIGYFRMIGCRLTNLTDGGEGIRGLRKTKEERIGMSRIQGGYPIFASDGRSWESMAFAAQELGATYMAVRAAVWGINPTVKGLTLSYRPNPAPIRTRNQTRQLALDLFESGLSVHEVAKPLNRTYVATYNIIYRVLGSAKKD